VHANEDERSVLQWGGLAGILGGILFILSWVVVLVGPVGMEDPADLAGWVTRFPEIRAGRVVENGIYLVALILGVMLFLALYRALRRTSLASALFGSALGILGLVVLMAGAVPHIAHAPLSELYHAPGATPEDQAAIALMWQATWGIFDALLYVGFFVVPTGIFLLGLGTLKAPTFGKGLGWLSVVLGVVGLAAAVLQMADPASMIGALSFFAIIIFYLVLGWKVYSLSRTRST
jgi:hypothetical protein